MARKKAPAKKKKAAVKKAPAVKRPPAIRNKMTKTAILGELAEKTDLSRKQVAAVIDELEVLIERHIKKGAAGEFTLPGLLKVRSVRRPATNSGFASPVMPTLTETPSLIFSLAQSRTTPRPTTPDVLTSTPAPISHSSAPSMGPPFRTSSARRCPTSVT